MNKIKHLNDYYVYRHIRLDSNTPFYVGKGIRNRAFDLDHRNSHHKRITKKHNCKIEILKYFISEDEAFDYERRLITLYKSFGYCEANLTNGGDGLSGFKHSIKTKKHASDVNREYWSNPINRLRVSLQQRKFNWHTPKGVFPTAQSAANYFKISNATVRNYVKDINKPEWYKQGVA